ncbi:Crp/Fnr family transcriptional regulator [Pseudoruegeria sp. HB172150]|uniref:Crp/Fnr family transcriptional regulator n=1 Tax=Pseudoruegeria sp. HB172150 TaxID=2721164 RepID=UPI00155350B4|nr:Crp/Fnr family transcriptional regulator [Pseudoruegeria sp. HB172150]
MFHDNLSGSAAILRTRGWLSKTPESFADALLERAMFRRLEKGATLFRADDSPSGLFGIVSGVVSVEQMFPDRGPAISGLNREGDWIGAIEIYDNSPRVSTVTATRNCNVVFVPRGRIIELTSSDPANWKWLGCLVSMQLRQVLYMLDDMRIRNPSGRIAATLLQLGNVRNVRQLGSERPSLEVTQSDVARLTTLSRSSVAEHLSLLERGGYISRSYGAIRITDVSRLRKLADEVSEDD